MIPALPVALRPAARPAESADRGHSAEDSAPDADRSTSFARALDRSSAASRPQADRPDRQAPEPVDEAPSVDPTTVAVPPAAVVTPPPDAEAPAVPEGDLLAPVVVAVAPALGQVPDPLVGTPGQMPVAPTLPGLTAAVGSPTVGIETQVGTKPMDPAGPPSTDPVPPWEVLDYAMSPSAMGEGQELAGQPSEASAEVAPTVPGPVQDPWELKVQALATGATTPSAPAPRPMPQAVSDPAFGPAGAAPTEAEAEEVSPGAAAATAATPVAPEVPQTQAPRLPVVPEDAGPSHHGPRAELSQEFARSQAEPAPSVLPATTAAPAPLPANSAAPQAPAAPPAPATPQAELAALPNPVERAIAQQVQRAWRDRGVDRHLVIRLTPPELGTVRVEFRNENGALTVALHAEDPAVRRALEQSLPHLKADLEQHGQAQASLSVGSGRSDAADAGAGQDRHSQERERRLAAGAAARGRTRGPAFVLPGTEPLATGPVQRRTAGLGLPQVDAQA